jgi:hypothetical protein
MEDYNEIPLESDSGYSFSTSLENNPYTFSIHWNVLKSAYFMSIKSDTLDVDIKGIRLVTNVNLLKPYPVTELGAMYLLDTSGDYSEATFESLGDTHILVYIPTTNPDAII